jgi:hypothetical protein
MDVSYLLPKHAGNGEKRQFHGRVQLFLFTISAERGQKADAKIQPQRPVLDVPNVVFNAPFDGRVSRGSH